MFNVKNIEQQSLLTNRLQPTINKDYNSQSPIVVHKKKAEKLVFKKGLQMQRLSQNRKSLFWNIASKQGGYFEIKINKLLIFCMLLTKCV
jgi:hypothetical protein